MFHVMFDAYKCTDSKMNNMRAVYDSVTKITDILGVATVMPPIVVPYYYGKEQSDDGISSFVLLRGGHFTIHTFPERGCYFVDMLYDGFFNVEKFGITLSKEFPSESFKTNIVDRRFDIKEQQKKVLIDPSKDFGPHYLIRNTNEVFLDLNKIYSFLDHLPLSIDMTPIMRPVVVTDNIKKPNTISGIMVIAQSHIALHYDIVSKKFYADIFSCSFVDCDDITSCIERELGTKCEIVLISRGSKHANILSGRDETIVRNARWLENI